MNDNFDFMNPFNSLEGPTHPHRKSAVVEQPVADYLIEESESSRLSIKDYLYALYNWRWLIIVSVFVFTALIAFYMVLKADMYEAETLVQVDLENSGPNLVADKGASSFLGGAGNDPAYFNTQLQILNSPDLLRGVVKKLQLDQDSKFITPDPWFVHDFESTKSKVLKSIGFIKARPTVSPDEGDTVAPSITRDELIEAQKLAPYLAFILKNLDVEPVQEKRTAFFKGTRLISIQFQHIDPKIAARVSNAIADALVEENRARRIDGNTVKSDYLSNRIGELRKQIREGEENLVAYSKGNQILTLEPGQNTVVDRLVGLNRQLLEAENERKLAEGAYRAALSPGAAGALVEDKDIARVIMETDTKLTELRQKRAQLLVQLTEEWPEVKETDKQIAVLEGFIDDTRKRATTSLLTNLETHYRQALAHEGDLKKAFQAQRGETVAQNEAAINYRIFQQEIETNKKLLEGLLQRSKENDIVIAGTPNNIHIMSYAMLPYQPIGPKRSLITSAAFMFMFFFCSGLVLLKEYMSDNVRSVRDVEKWLKVPVLGTIPSSNSRGLLPRLRGMFLTKKNGTSTSMSDIGSSPQLIESYRQLRNSLQLTAHCHAFKTLLVTSSFPEEGKTSTAINLAESFAHAGARVLLIDADLRGPRLHILRDLENDEGLTTLLSKDLGEIDTIPFVRRHEVNGVFLLPAGPPRSDRAELLDAQKLQKLLDGLRESFDYIIIDSSPVLTFSDAMLLSAVVDEVLFVVKSDSIAGSSVRRARQLLHNVGASIIGVVLNDVDPHSPHFYLNADQGHYYYNSNVGMKELPNGTKD